jgi:hypothetical protein
MTREFTEDEVLALARRAYRHGKAEFQLLPDRAALLVIDMQDEFVRPGWTPYWIPQATRQVSRLARLLATCRPATSRCCTPPLPPPTGTWTGRAAAPPCPAATRSWHRRPGLVPRRAHLAGAGARAGRGGHLQAVLWRLLRHAAGDDPRQAGPRAVEHAGPDRLLLDVRKLGDVHRPQVDQRAGAPNEARSSTDSIRPMKWTAWDADLAPPEVRDLHGWVVAWQVVAGLGAGAVAANGAVGRPVARGL